ncbi:MAG: NAD(P)H-hydrate dehydratase [Burkholderiaceae bacterium]
MPLIRLNPNTSYALHSVAATRSIELAAAAQLAPHSLMQRAGLAVARLACALAPHLQTIWLACGPGNNGGDGLEAAMHLKQWGRNPVVTWLGDEARCPADALLSLHRARQAGVTFAAEPPAEYDFAIDALLGIGQSKPVTGVLADWLRHMQATAPAVLCVDVPSGLNADTGNYTESEIAIKNIAVEAINTKARGQNTPIFCLSLLTLKPGLFTAHGKDAAGDVWFDDLGVDIEINTSEPSAWLLGADRASLSARLHASHKGSFGDVVVVGGAAGMTGAALLAAKAALHAGAGRVFVALLDAELGEHRMMVDPLQPELMFRSLETLPLRLQTLVCGCGGGDAVRHVLPQVLSQAPRLVLDADALNAIAVDSSLQTLLLARSKRGKSVGFSTVLTPHPLEAARLLGMSTAQVQADRLLSAQTLADRFACVVILKGAGSVIASLGQTPHINASGNAKLATAGTGDVLAGVVGAVLAAGETAFSAACIATYRHGAAADQWPADQTLTASGLSQRI